MDIALVMELADSSNAIVKTFIPVVNKIQEKSITSAIWKTSRLVQVCSYSFNNMSKCFRGIIYHDPQKCKYKNYVIQIKIDQFFFY